MSKARKFIQKYTEATSKKASIDLLNKLQKLIFDKDTAKLKDFISKEQKNILQALGDAKSAFNKAD